MGKSRGRSSLLGFQFPSRQAGSRWILRRVVSPAVLSVLLQENERAQG